MQGSAAFWDACAPSRLAAARDALGVTQASEDKKRRQLAGTTLKPVKQKQRKKQQDSPYKGSPAARQKPVKQEVVLTEEDFIPFCQMGPKTLITNYLTLNKARMVRVPTPKGQSL